MTQIKESTSIFTELNSEDAASINGGVALEFRRRGLHGKKIRVGFWRNNRFINVYKGRDTDLNGTVDTNIRYLTNRMQNNGVSIQNIKDVLSANGYTSNV